MSAWTHSICKVCWDKKNPDRPAVTMKEEHRKIEVCCYCAESHFSGIFIRDNPRDLACNGKHLRD